MLCMGQAREEEIPLQELNIEQLKVVAQQNEQKGQKVKAAAVYEVLVEKAPETRRALMSRLAVLYAESGMTNQALKWAAEASWGGPTPKRTWLGLVRKWET